MRTDRAICALVLAVVLPRSSPSQTVSPAPDSGRPRTTFQSERLIIVNGDSVERWGDHQRRGESPGTGYLLRSASSLTSKAELPGLRWIQPEVHAVYNSGLPFSINEGGIWAGRGVAWLFTGGVDVQLGKVRLLLAPQFSLSTNRWWSLRDSVRFSPPTQPYERRGSGYMFPWYEAPYSIDLPLRYGDVNLSRFSFGQSSLSVDAKALTIGISSENEWWGPGVRNAIILSSNAPGFPHLFVRTSHPLETRLGSIQFRWLSGALYESKWFDLDLTNNVRSIAAFGATISPQRNENLSFGFARSVYSTAGGTAPGLFRFFDVFKNTGHPNDRPFGDSTLTPGGSDQVYSLFARWVMPRNGLETYTELGRTEFPKSLRDLLVHPSHTIGYTLGLQWNKPEGRSRLQAEITNLEQSSSFRDRAIGSWYTSRRVIQGYTNQGQALGAAIGPGSSSQWLAWDYLFPDRRFGMYAARIRWNEDMRSVYRWPAYLEYCNHDVSYMLGWRAGGSTRVGFVSADFSVANRLNAFFQKQSTCIDNISQRDIRNNTLRLTFRPLSR